jgi:hypothetical protein
MYIYRKNRLTVSTQLLCGVCKVRINVEYSHRTSNSKIKLPFRQAFRYGMVEGGSI